MEIFDTLKKDHKVVLDLLEKMESSSERAKKTREQAYTKFKKEIMQHMYGEENTFYKFLLQHDDMKEMAFEALEEHRTVRLAMPDLDSKDVGDEQWKPILSVIAELLKHHINEEEGDIFEEAEKLIDEENDQRLVSEFQAAKQEAEITV
ncbi:MAG: hemerythrin domain-containing protein [Phycisphaerales bacterium]